jgi:tetratricopeptide (TPR) repeat protein
MDVSEGRADDPTAWTIAAHVSERRGQGQRAVALSNEALNRDPRRALAWIVRGWAHLRVGDLPRAENDLRLGEALRSGGLNRAWATIGLGRVDEARGRRAQARARYEQVLGDPALVRALQLGGVDHVSDLRRRVASLAGG